MASPSTHPELEKIGRDLIRWRAETILTWCIACLAAVAGLLGTLDFLFHVGRAGRWLTGGLMLALLAGALWLLHRVLRHRFSTQGVAARVEQAFPELDNHLINYVQFTHNPESNPFKTAYVERTESPWRNIDVRRMKPAKQHQRSRLALALALALLLVPAAFFGKAWGVAVWRMVNPFTRIEPVTLTRIVGIAPGDVTVLQGEPVILTCTVDGFEGHEVLIDIDPADADTASFSLGRVSSVREQAFSRRIARATTELRYRFRAGDARPSPWHTVTPRPPPALTDLYMTIAPPAYTGLSEVRRDAREGEHVVPQGSEVAWSVTANTPLESATLQVGDGDPMSLVQADVAWVATTAIVSGRVARIRARDVHGFPVEEEVRFRLKPDHPPVIQVVSPQGRVVLPPGESPRIEFQVHDDYGLVRVTVEEAGFEESNDTVVARAAWDLESSTTFHEVWKSATSAPRGRPSTFRVVARDNNPSADGPASSPAIVFNARDHGEAARERGRLEERAMAALHQVVELQRRNILQTETYRTALSRTTAEHWEQTAERQRTIRSRTKELLANPIEPLGGMTPAIRDLYVNEMSHAVTALAGVAAAEPASRNAPSAEALHLQEKILRQLTLAQAAAAEARIARRMTGLSAMLGALVRDQGQALKQTREFAETRAEVGPALVDTQDALAEDVTAFREACDAESSEVRAGDAALADTLEDIALRCEEAGIRNDMVMAAEHLDQNLPAEAVPFEDRALLHLNELQALFDGVRLKAEQDQRTAMLEAVGQAREKMSRMHELHERMLEAMDSVREQEDKNDEMVDLLESAYEDLIGNTKEVLLEVPTDLHVFTDLNVANDLVEDVFSVYEEIEQVEGSEEWTDQEAVERAFAKEEIVLDMMAETMDRLDDMEMWLEDIPDHDHVTTETFDREEMPESGIAVGSLATEVQDLITDLLDEPDALNEAADDGATTHALPDWEAGWKVEEGDIASYGAKGKSGSQTPDHKEQDGRSNVGRQGMSVGETAAGSGTISEGDKDIEARRTEDPTQSGQIDLAGQADTRATGGGKLGTGKADDLGMAGGVERMDSTEEGSWEGMAALMAKQADSVYARASMKNVRVDDLKEAAHFLRQSADAVARGHIAQGQEFKRLAVTSLQKARAELAAGPSGAMNLERTAPVLNDTMEDGLDLAPPQYQDLVAEYYKALSKEL